MYLVYGDYTKALNWFEDSVKEERDPLYREWSNYMAHHVRYLISRDFEQYNDATEKHLNVVRQLELCGIVEPGRAERWIAQTLGIRCLARAHNGAMEDAQSDADIADKIWDTLTSQTGLPRFARFDAAGRRGFILYHEYKNMIAERVTPEIVEACRLLARSVIAFLGSQRGLEEMVRDYIVPIGDCFAHLPHSQFISSEADILLKAASKIKSYDSLQSICQRIIDPTSIAYPRTPYQS